MSTGRFVCGVQRTACRLIAGQRLDSGESYVAGGTRISRDIDLFHDTTEAVVASWQADRKLLESHGYQVRAHRERDLRTLDTRRGCASGAWDGVS
jgi:hypothetical protein